jgi:hypothetical protein
MVELTENEKQLTKNEELTSLIKEGNFFLFCVLYATKLGFKDAIKNKQEVKFYVGDYFVTFDTDKLCFTLSHNIYIARIIVAGYHESVFIGEDENEVIADVLLEFNKTIAIH